jgi:predicted dehydrogenase
MPSHAPSSPSFSSPALSRRSFVRGLGAGLALAPLYVPARAFGANDRIRLGLIGVGKQGMGLLKGYLGMDDVEIRAIADLETFRRDMAKKLVEERNAAQKRNATVEASLDYKDMLGKDLIDAVVIATPDHWHTAQIIHAAQAKKHIYCEKPLTLTLEESDLAVKAVRKYGVTLQTGSQQRSENEGRFRKACEIVRSGRLGKIHTVSVHFGPTAKVCDLHEEKLDAGLDWERWLGQAPQRPYHHLLCQRGAPDTYPFLPGWRDYREYSGGQVTDWGCHHLDILQWALGMDGSGPVAALPPPKGTDPAKGLGQLIYKNTPVGDEIVVTHRTYGNGVRIIGTDGELWVNRGELLSTPDKILKEPLGDKDVKLEDTGGNHKRNWLACIREKREPICKVEVGAGSAAVCHLLNLAYWNGRRVDWDPKTWALKGAPKEWRNRKARKGYELPKV